MSQHHIISLYQFVYEDSSEEQNQLQKNKIKDKIKINFNPEIEYKYSSNLKQSLNPKLQQKLSKQAKQKKQSIKIHPDAYILKDRYLDQIQKIIKQNYQKLTKQTALLIPDTDKQIISNLQKRKKKYGFFLRNLQVDRNYNSLLTKKVAKVKQQNQKKREVYAKMKEKKIIDEEKDQFQNYILKKKNKEQIIIDKIQKHAYKLGIQRIRAKEKQIKNQKNQIHHAKVQKMTNLLGRKKNTIQNLKGQLQSIREAKKLNKDLQKKTIKELQREVEESKNFILTKVESIQQRKFMI